MRLVVAERAPDIAAARSIFLDYAASLPVDLGFQGFDAELASLPGEYAAPHGQLLLARRRAARPSPAARCGRCTTATTPTPAR